MKLSFIAFAINFIGLFTFHVFSQDTDLVPGLYDDFPQLERLNGSNFYQEIYHKQKHKLWVVEFYKHWCGDCIRFVHVTKSLAIDIYEWRNYMRVGTLDCANSINTAICRKYRVGKVPSLKIIEPFAQSAIPFGDQGKFNNKSITYGDIRDKAVQTLREYQYFLDTFYPSLALYEIGRVNLISITDSDLKTLWDTYPRDVKYLVLVFENRDAVAGSCLALDLSSTKEVMVRLVSPENHDLYHQVGMAQSRSGVVILQNPKPVFHFESVHHTREELNAAVRKFLINKGVSVPPDLPKIPKEFPFYTEEQVNDAAKREEELKKAANVTNLLTVVFQKDLEAALHRAFNQEVTLTAKIMGKPLKALRDFVDVLSKYFPTGANGKKFFEDLKRVVWKDGDFVSGIKVQRSFQELTRKYNPFMPHPNWVGCLGTVPMYRGYPCSMWTLFHTLVALEELHGRNKPNEKPEVLNAMAGYIENFFSCEACSTHFSGMAQTIAGNVTTQRDAVMWLWKAHNNVNKRLAGDVTEDPRIHKVQFPPKDVCPDCSPSEGTWDEETVFTFLSNKYTTINTYNPDKR